MILAFAFTWLVVRHLGAHGFGLVELMQTVVNTAGLATLNLEAALIRFLPDFRSRQWGQATRRLTWLIFAAKAALAALASVLLYFLAAAVARSYDQPQLTLAIRFGCLSLFASALVTTGKAFCLGWLRPRSRALLSFLRRLFELTGLLAVFALDRLDVTHVMAVLALADALTAVAFLTLVFYYLHREPAAADTIPLSLIIRRIWHYCLPLIGVQLTEVGGPNITRLLLGRLAPPAVLGFYAIARQVAGRLMLFMSQLPVMAVPVLAARLEQGTQAENGAIHGLIGRLLQYQWALGSLANLAVWAAAPLLLLVFGEGDVRPVEPALRFLGFTVLLWAGAAVTHVYFFVYEQTAGIFLLNLSQLLLAGLLYLLFVPRWGATGAALADVIAQAFELALGLWLVYRWFSFPAGRYIPPLLKQLALVTLLVLPVWLWPSAALPLLALWAVAAVLLLVAYLLRQGLPAPADLQTVAHQDWGHPRLNQAKSSLCQTIGRYQTRLQEI